MAKGTDARTQIGMRCSKCKRYRRNAEKNTKTTIEKLEQKKYCPFCKSVQVFKEAKIGK